MIAATAKRFQVLAANRLATIHALSKVEEWNFIPGDQNAADCLSRGVRPKFKNTQNFPDVPTFLNSPKNEWPQQVFETEFDTNEFIKNKVVMAIGPEATLERIIQQHIVKDYSWKQTVRVFSYVRKYLDNLRQRTLDNKASGSSVQSGMGGHRDRGARPFRCGSGNEVRLDQQDLQRGENLIFTILQRHVMGKDYDDLSKLPKRHEWKKYDPIKVDGVIRARSRLRFAGS